jgi:hypothetical protein
MPRYYFNLRNGDEFALDEEGLELRSVQAAQAEAATSLADMAREAAHHSAPVSRRDMAIEVRDETGPVMQVKFIFAVEKPKN